MVQLEGPMGQPNILSAKNGTHFRQSISFVGERVLVRGVAGAVTPVVSKQDWCRSWLQMWSNVSQVFPSAQHLLLCSHVFFFPA